MKEEPRIGYALCGSYCTFSRSVNALERLCSEYKDVTPIMSENAYSTDTRFGKASDFIKKIEGICGRQIIHTIAQAEPIGPRATLDLLIIAPCTGNTLSKLAFGITDSSVTMAAKAHMRNGRPVLIAVATNDGLSGSAPAIGRLLGRKNIFFVPFYQDSPQDKPTSLVARFEMIKEAAAAALRGVQLQPLLTAL